MLRPFLTTASALSSLLFSAPVPTVVVPIPFSDLARRAEVIVVATVTGSTSRIEEGGRTIRTYVGLGELDVQKGRIDGKLELRFEGGKVGERRLWIPGMPELLAGHRYLLFLCGNGTALSPIVGFDQGALEVTALGGHPVLTSLRGCELVGIRDDRFVFVAKPVSGDPMHPKGPPLAGPEVTTRPAPVVPSHDSAPIFLSREDDPHTRITIAELVTKALAVR